MAEDDGDECFFLAPSKFCRDVAWILGVVSICAVLYGLIWLDVAIWRFLFHICGVRW